MDTHVNNTDEDQDKGKTTENLDPEKGKGEGSDHETTWQELAGVDPKEFDTPEKLAKSYKDARKGLSDQGQELKATKEFQENVTPLLKAVYGNPELYKQVLGEVKKLYGEEPTDKADKDQPVKDPRVDELAGMEESRVVSDFESSVKLNTKSSDEKEKVRKQIGAIMKRWLPVGSKPTLQQLPVMLKDAWRVYRDESGIEDEPEETNNLSLGFGTPRAVQATIDKMDVSSLTPQERKAAERMGISVEDYLKEKKSIMRV